MPGLTDFGEQKALEHFFRGTIYTPPVQVYQSLFLGTPNDAGAGGTEVTGAGYARKAVGFGSYSGRTISNSAPVGHAASANWGQVTTFGLHDAATAGNMLAFGPVGLSPTINNGQTLDFAVGQITVDLQKFGPWLAQRILELLFKNTAHSSISGSVFNHLNTTQPNDDGAGGVVLAATGYAPKLAAFAPYSAGRCNLSADLQHTAAAPVAWGAIPGFSFYDGSNPLTANFLVAGLITPLPTVGVGAPFGLKATDTYVGLD